MTTVEIDATDQVLGRLATRIALTLRGKNNPTYRPDRLPEIRVVVTNAKAIKLSGSKATQKTYYHFSGYPGGLKETNFATKQARDPNEIVRLAVRRMLPDNKLRPRMMKQLTFA